MPTIPAWVKNYPHEMDKAALINLINATHTPLEKPREMNFSLYGLPDQKSTQAAVDMISKKGWKCRVFPQEDEPSKLCLEASKQGYVINQEHYENDSAFFMRIADMYGGGYDGWYASV